MIILIKILEKKKKLFKFIYVTYLSLIGELKKMRGKKIVAFLLCMLVITNGILLIPKNTDVRADNYQHHNGENEIGLNTTYVWEMVKQFCNVTFDADWSEENNIPKGRSWATAGENYTIDNILKRQWENFTDPVFQKLPIGPITYGPYKDRLYSNKIVINDYNLTINTNPPKYLPYNETFPIGIGVNSRHNDLNDTYGFDEATIKELNLFLKDYLGGTYFNDCQSVSTQFLNTEYLIGGSPVFLNETETVPENQNDLVFLMNETEDCKNKLDNITTAVACILINSASFGYSYTEAEEKQFPILRVDEDDENLTKILSEMENGSVYFVDNNYDPDTLVFTNLSNDTCVPDETWVYVVQRLAPSDKNATDPFYEALGLIGPGAYYDFIRLEIRQAFWYWYHYSVFGSATKGCKGFIISDFNDTHFMTHTVKGWGTINKLLDSEDDWFSAFTDRWWLPMFSVNESIGEFLIANNYTVTGSIKQTYHCQNSTNPGVISHNFIGYRNITQDETAPVTILSNRIDGWWGTTPGDSGVGGAILLGIAKYFNDYNIIPKCNLRFLFTTGEEYGMRGAQHYNDSHPHNVTIPYNNITRWIGFDQLGFNYTTSDDTINLTVNVLDDTTKTIIRAIANDTQYLNRTGYGIWVGQPDGYGSEDKVFKTRENCSTICFGKDNSSRWDGYHRAGADFSKGDSLQYIDRNDVNVTFELAWNVTKYFTVNPDCWFDNVTFTAFDSPNDGDTLNDSIRTNFTIHSVLPSDKVRVELNLSSEVNDVGSQNPTADYIDYLLTYRSQNESYVFTIPDSVADGYYNVSFTLYNSTGRINKIVYGSPGSYYNDTTGASGWYHLYHPLGYTKIGDTYKCVNDNISGSVFTANEYGTADNITAFINQAYMSPGQYNCMLYRASDNALIGTTTSDWVSLPQEDPESSSWWAVFNFTGTKPLLVKGTQYVMTCWGDSTYSRVYYNESNGSGTGRYDAHPYGSPPDPANFTNESRYYSIYCIYTPDSTLPQISAVNASPHTVGFGYNVTITANVTDDLSGVDLVKVQIGYPGGKSGNFTMTHTMGETYQYLFTDTWLVGQYNYTIWVIDNSSNSNSSTGHHFHVSADASISIATLQDSYTGSQYINITDPPNSPENYTLIDRGLTWDKYYDTTTGQNILEVSTGPINYPEENGTWTPINTTLSQLAENHSAYVYGYRSGNDHGLYGVYFKSNAQNEWPVAFTYNKSDDPTIHAVRSKLVGVGYVDPQNNWTYQYLQSVQSSQGQTNDYSITYPGVFTGTDVTWSYGNTGMKEEITLSNATKTVLQNHPPSQYGLNNTSSYLVFITKLDYQNLNLYNNSGLFEGNVTISDMGIEFKDILGQFKCALPLGEAYELNNESVRQKLTYRIVHLNGNTYLLSGLKLSDLNTMTFPVVIDPTLTVYSSNNDGYIEQSSTSYNTAWTTSTGTVHDTVDFINIGQYKFKTTYYIYRSFLHFNTSALPSNAYFDNATLSLYKRTDYSTTDFDITIQNGQPTYPHDPLQTSDYNKSHYSGNGGALNTANLTSGYNPITLTNLTWINTTGITKLCLRSSRDINGIAPTGNEFISVYSRDFVFAYPPKLVISYRNQSKIKNSGSTDIKGYLLIQIQFYNTSQSTWVLDNDTINETTPRIITSGNQLALDTIFNGNVRVSDLTHGIGTYRVYTAYRDPEGNILRTNDDVDLEAWWQFNKT